MEEAKGTVEQRRHLSHHGRRVQCEHLEGGASQRAAAHRPQRLEQRLERLRVRAPFEAYATRDPHRRLRVAYGPVSMVTADFDEQYPIRVTFESILLGSVTAAYEPSPLETLTMVAALDARSSSNMACVTRTTPKTLVS